MRPSLTLRGERWTSDGMPNATKPTDRSEIASRQATRRARVPEGGA